MMIPVEPPLSCGLDIPDFLRRQRNPIEEAMTNPDNKSPAPYKPTPEEVKALTEEMAVNTESDPLDLMSPESLIAKIQEMTAQRSTLDIAINRFKKVLNAKIKAM